MSLTTCPSSSSSSSSSSSCSPPSSTLVANDDYCDSGDDEPQTSACSHHVSRPKFQCAITTTIAFPIDLVKSKFTIPTSRVQDGVCDCCDGSDEVNNPNFPGSSCPNTCEEMLNEYRLDTLRQYNRIKNGLQARNQLVHVQEQKSIEKKVEIKQLEGVKLQIQELVKEIKNYDYYEEKRETTGRQRLLLERQWNCVIGYNASCDFFASRWLTEDTYPYGASSEVFRVNDVNSCHVPNAESNRFQYVRDSCCLHSHLLPDEHATVQYKNLDNYLKARKSAPSSLLFDRPLNIMRQETLFGPYLERGERGHREAIITLLNVVGFLLCPFIYVFQLLWRCLMECWNIISKWTRFHSFVDFIRSYIPWEAHVFDIRSNSVVIALLDRLHPLPLIPLFLHTFLLHQPQLQYQLWFTQNMTMLPVRREACLLRQGLINAKQQIDRIDGLISVFQRNDLISTAQTQYNQDFLYAHLSTRVELMFDKTKLRKDSQSQMLSVPIDYGCQEEWKAVATNCLKQRIRSYEYEFCFFNKVNQDRVSLGQFAGWGTWTSVAELVESMNKPTSKNAGITSAVVRVPEKEAKVKQLREDHPDMYFAYQLFVDGEECYGGKKRVTEVHFQCGEVNAIDDVVETEVCVYQMTVTTPMACSSSQEQAIAQQLRALGVDTF